MEPNTVFYARPPAGLPDDDRSYEIQRRGQRRLAALGYEQYEVSAYARGGRTSVHNLNYWQFGDYLAAGAGAHGKYSDATGIWRYAKPANPKQYMEAMERGTCPAALKAVPAAERLFEFMLNALRLSDGFDEGLFHERTGLAVEELRQRLEPAIKKGLIASAPENFWRVTPLGQRFLNDLQAEFLQN